jgi:pimeloyl-ACP methyl ester carboxylesterase
MTTPAKSVEPVEQTKPVEPTIVLVHGAWHGAWCWNEVVPFLTARGLAVIAVDLPGHGNDTRLPGSLLDDAAALADIVANVDGPVAMVGHSYGGLVISQTATDPAIAAKLSHLVYLCALCLPAGKKLADLSVDNSRARLRGLLTFNEDGNAVVNAEMPVEAKACFYHDCTDAQAAYAMQRLTPQPMTNMATVVEGNPMASIHSTYVFCTEDFTIPIEVQRAMVNAVRDSGVTLNEVTLASSHSPFFSMPNQLAHAIAEVVSHSN